jgi:hypothetical protein
VYVLAACYAVCDIFGCGVERVVAHAAVFRGGGNEVFAVLLETGLEERRCLADEVFVHSEASGMVEDPEADDFGAGARGGEGGLVRWTMVGSGGLGGWRAYLMGRGRLLGLREWVTGISEESGGLDLLWCVEMRKKT